MVYVALLRGINVGGKNKVDMKQLKNVFEQAGMEHVKTYINSGNIVFVNRTETKSKIPSILEKAILEGFGLEIKVLVLDLDDYKQVMAALPDTWRNDDQMKSDVLFIWEEFDNESVLEKLPVRQDVDTVMYVNRAILWSVDRKNVTKSGMNKIIGTELYKKMTVRNVNTTRKIFDLMLAAEKLDQSH
ncbi:DUF1697 domain-containing protein [Bacillus horti]|uniref:Uncharacterized protein (DUF1697 family) n=1 Tax=Caldalkalibacillus horti TaxID=77523 RepID=A0ABT9W5T0_9BACI|nr:DUF1697 domain-containing protein [Bacillus horti]MDQ0168424.1 uncharacterized protein (DUF1697 family) [Bacillus horti]